MSAAHLASSHQAGETVGATGTPAPTGDVPLLEVPPTPDQRLRRWLGRSLSNRIAATAALLTVGVVLTLGTLAYVHAHALVVRNAAAQLNAQARLFAHGLELSLTSLGREVESLAANTLFTNALLDASGRNAYLQPFMRDYRLQQAERFTLTLTDYRGATLLTTGDEKASDYRRAAWLRSVLEGGAAYAAVTEGEALRLLIARPVVYPGTGKAEGMLVLDIDLLDLLRTAAKPLANDVRKTLLVGERDVAAVLGAEARLVDPASGPQQGGDWLVERETLRLSGVMQALQIGAQVSVPRGTAVQGLGVVAGTFVLAGVLAVVLAVVLARLASRRVVGPLWRLSRAADRVRREQRFDVALPDAGEDEVGRLTKSLSHMMASLRDARDTLESQVTARTAALAAAQARLTALLDNMRDGVLLIDADDQIESINRGGERMFGVSAAEAVGAHAAFLVPGWQKTAMTIRRGGQAARHDGAHVTEVIAQRGDTTFQAELSISRTEHDGRLHWILVVRDVTERKRAADVMLTNQQKLLELVSELRTRDRHMGHVNRMNEMLQCCQSSTEAYRVIERSLRELFATASGALAVMRSDGESLETVLRWGDGALADAEFAVQDCWALRRGQAHRSEPGGVCCAHHGDVLTAEATCLPLSVQGETLGLLMVDFGADASPDLDKEGSTALPLHERQLQLLSVVGEAIKFALSNLKLREALREAALRDRLTGLYNRRYLDETLPRELHRARRVGKPLVAAMLDLDHFKRLNDQFGHEAGDLVLREVGRVLATSLRASDVACRYGGEELTALMADADLTGAIERLDEIRTAVRALKLHHSGQPLPTITVSIGVAQATTLDTPASLLRNADEALYRAKKDGRDRVVSTAVQPVTT